MSEKILMKGNEALAESAIRAGCRFYYAYPITPQNEIPAYMAKYMPKAGGTFLQAESELAAISMVMGTSATGNRVMTSTSSPGMSLKQEGISYLSGCRLPCVIVNMMRGGPGLGNIAGAQGDYYQATRGGGNGDYRNIVLAPATVQEITEITVRAFDLADEYRIPVIILGDGYLGQMSEPVELPEPVINKKEKSWALTGAAGRHGKHIASIHLNPENALEQHNYLLNETYETIARKVQFYETYLTEDADYIVTAYGTMSRSAKKAIKILREQGIKAGLFRPISLWPFPGQKMAEIVKRKKKLLCLEMSFGQMLDDVLIACQKYIDVDFLGRPGGLIPDLEKIIERVKSYE